MNDDQRCEKCGTTIESGACICGHHASPPVERVGEVEEPAVVKLRTFVNRTWSEPAPCFNDAECRQLVRAIDRSRPAQTQPAGGGEEREARPCFHCGMSLTDCANLEDPTCCRGCSHPKQFDARKGTP